MEGNRSKLNKIYLTPHDNVKSKYDFTGYINNKCTYYYVDSSKSLLEISDILKTSEVIAVDSERSYFNSPSLLQICNNKFDLILIDLLKIGLTDIDNILIPVFSSKKILKLIFDKKNDLIHFERHNYQFTYSCLNIIDIQTLGIGRLSKTKVGLKKFCEEWNTSKNRNKHKIKN